MTVAITPANVAHHFAVYTHTVALPSTNGPVDQIIYVGMCKAPDVMTSPDAHRNTEWMETVKSYPDVKLDIVAIFKTRHDAAIYHSTLVTHHASHGQAFCNTHGKTISTGKRVMCIETGETFNNASEACARYGAYPSAMSNHLNGNTAFKTVKGHTFTRIGD